MALATISIPLRTYQPGIMTIAERDLPDRVSGLKLTLDRTNWTDQAVKLQGSLECLEMDGVTWTACGGFTAEGGPPPPRGANVMMAEFLFPHKGTRIRGSLVLSGGNLRTSGTLEAF